MREDGGLIGYGMATAVYGVPARERIHAALPAALWAWSCRLARGADRAGGHLDRAPTGAAARGEDPFGQEGSPVQVPITVESPAGRFTGCVVNT